MKQFAVIGLGRFGASVAATLAAKGQQVIAIDSNEDNVND
ncbi:MAG: NAD-binding protein, partial [Candidatus Omnitrophica bacterium]|nr:NAD-binding protein [Candidatus Omnitrophota bacterium]